MNELMEWSQGNPGAMNFLMEVFLNKETPLATTIAVNNKIKNCKTLRGTNLYVWYSDICNKDLDFVKKIAQEVPNEILEDACSRQDYSGKKLITDFLEKNN